MSEFSINGVAIKNPSGFKIERYTITKSNRVASGDMVMDFVANKLKFFFTYDAISSSELDVILDQLWTNLSATRECFVTLTYTDNGQSKTARVYAGAIPSDLHSAKAIEWVWKGVTFNLIER